MNLAGPREEDRKTNRPGSAIVVDPSHRRYSPDGGTRRVRDRTVPVQTRSTGSLIELASRSINFRPFRMRRLFAFAALLLCFGLSSCQCSEKPDIGPVEDDDQQSTVTVEVSANRV
jgi:hypothetical protein